MPTIQSDVAPIELNRDSAALAFLDRWKDPKEVSKDGKEAEAPDEETIIKDPKTTEIEEDPDAEAAEDPTEDNDTEEEDAPPKKAAKSAQDDDEVTFSVDGVEQKVSVKDLKRLAGQEAALTRKSQDVSAKTKAAEDLQVHHITALNTLVQKAEDAYRPYAELDMLVASREMSPEDFAAVRSEAARTYQDYKFLTEELGGAVQQQTVKQEQSFQVAAADCIKTLSDPVKGIEGYDQNMYNEMCAYAVSVGMKPGVAYKITDPDAFRIIHKAMAYDKIKSVATKKVATSAKTVMKSTSSTTTSKTSTDKDARSAMKKLQASGSRQDATELLLQRWKKSED